MRRSVYSSAATQLSEGRSINWLRRSVSCQELDNACKQLVQFRSRAYVCVPLRINRLLESLKRECVFHFCERSHNNINQHKSNNRIASHLCWFMFSWSRIWIQLDHNYFRALQIALAFDPSNQHEIRHHMNYDSTEEDSNCESKRLRNLCILCVNRNYVQLF